MEVCPKCYGDIKDYGGYKDKMSPKGINITEIWYDIPPVRHSKYKRRVGANELSIKLLDKMASDPGDLVFDPFGGGGTTYVVCEMKKRRWVGIELGPVDEILNRFKDIKLESEYLNKIREDYNVLFTDKTKMNRLKRGFWTVESLRIKSENKSQDAALPLKLDI
jgi:site-specific DNA-methyltransferase (adenine-specific)